MNSELIGPPGSNNGTGIHLNAFDSDFPALANRSGNFKSSHESLPILLLLSLFFSKSFILKLP